MINSLANGNRSCHIDIFDKKYCEAFCSLSMWRWMFVSSIYVVAWKINIETALYVRPIKWLIGNNFRIYVEFPYMCTRNAPGFVFPAFFVFSAFSRFAGMYSGAVLLSFFFFVCVSQRANIVWILNKASLLSAIIGVPISKSTAREFLT